MLRPIDTIWNHLLVMVLGLWLMISPAVMGYEGPERLINLFTGALVASMALIASIETTRMFRWFNVILGTWLMLAPPMLHYHPFHIGVRSSLIGLAIIGLSLIDRSRHRQRARWGWIQLSLYHGKREG